MKLPVIVWAGSALIGAICSTLRYRVEGWENFEESKASGRNIIFCFWHNQIFYGTHFWRGRNIVVMSSEHFDGECTTRIIRNFGFQVAKGSSTRGAVRGLLELKRRLEKGDDVAFTADGPKGPIYRVKPGPVWLSQKTGAPILPFHMQPEKYWKMKSWDGFRIPKPYTTVLVKIGPGLIVPPGGDEDDWLPIYQQEMEKVSYYAENYWNTPRPVPEHVPSDGR